MRLLIPLFLIIICSSCNKQEKLQNQNTLYSDWQSIDSIDGYTYFRVNSMAFDSKDELYFSSFLRKNFPYHQNMGYLRLKMTM